MTACGARGRPGRGARALRPPLTSHPSRDLGPSERPVRSRSLSLHARCSRDARCGHRPGPRLLSSSSQRLSFPPPRRSPGPAPERRAPRPIACSPQPPPLPRPSPRASLTEIRRPFQSSRLLAAVPREQAPGFGCLRLPQPIRSQQRRTPSRPLGLTFREAVGVAVRSEAPIGGSAGSPQRATARAVRVGREAWAVVLALGRRWLPIPVSTCVSRPVHRAPRTPRTRTRRPARPSGPPGEGACAGPGGGRGAVTSPRTEEGFLGSQLPGQRLRSAGKL